MKAKRMWLLLAGVIGFQAVSAGQSVDLRPMVVTNLTGGLRVQQGIPCDDDVDVTTPVTGGRIELTPAEGIPVTGGKMFGLTRADISFAGFSVSCSCLTIDRTRTYQEIGVQLARTVSFTATVVGADVFAVTIPKANIVIYESALVNGELETGYLRPSEDVTGTIDFANGTASLRVVIAQRIRFRAGCVPVVGCVIDEERDGTLAATVAGTIVFPDTDGDGVPDRSDNCKLVPNADQSPVATPSITPPPNVTLSSCASRDFGVAAATDRCDGGLVTVTNNAPATFAVGPNIVMWRAQDAKGRLAIAMQTVTVADTTPPTFTSVPPDLALNNCGPADLGLPTATDDCAGTPTFTNDAPASFGVGTTMVTWTATDASGNTQTATQLVTVTDTVAPAVSCTPAWTPGGAFQVIATDACTSHPIVRLGSYALTSGETIKIEEIGRPGVVELLQPVGPDGIRHFLVGRGEAVISATDSSSNTATAVCR